MKITIANPQKGRLETIEIKFTDRNTTWFDDDENDDGIYMITERGYSYPVLVYDKIRKDINYDQKKARQLKSRYE